MPKEIRDRIRELDSREQCDIEMRINELDTEEFAQWFNAKYGRKVGRI